MTTPEHLKIEVPLPHTCMLVGRHAVSDAHDGFSVRTDGHVWLTALDSSTFSGHSQGAFRVVSDTSNVYTAAKVGVTAATTGGATIAAPGGVKIIAGYDAQPAFQPPDVEIGVPSPADDVSAGCDEVATAWTIADTTVAALLTAKAAGLMVLGNKDNTVRETLTTSNAIGAMGLASGLAGIATNAAGMGGATAPGINVHAKGGINITTPAFCSIYGMGGLLMASPFNTQVFGAATLGVSGLASAGMSSLGKVDLASSKGISAVGGTKCNITSTFGEVVIKGGKGVSIGQVLADPDNVAQLVTAKMKLDAKIGMRLTSGKGEVRLGRTPEDIPVETQVQTGTQAAFAAVAAADGGSSSAPVGSIQAPAIDPTQTLTLKVEATEASLVATESLTLAVGSWIVSISADGVTLGMGVATPAATPDANTAAAPQFTGPQLKMDDSELTAAMMPAGGALTMNSDGVTLSSTVGGTVEVTSDGVAVSDFAMVTFA
ncbi:MAG: hypothetical protein AB8I08_06270 [Sandaracinaceae bacterium]